MSELKLRPPEKLDLSTIRIPVPLFGDFGERAFSFHQPTADGKTDRAHGDSCEHICDVVIAAIDRGDAHAREKWQANPEKPSPVAIGREKGNHGTGHVRGRERGAVDARETFDESNCGRETTAP